VPGQISRPVLLLGHARVVLRCLVARHEPLLWQRRELRVPHVALASGTSDNRRYSRLGRRLIRLERQHRPHRDAVPDKPIALNRQPSGFDFS
jgi:hypothetical protein